MVNDECRVKGKDFWEVASVIQKLVTEATKVDHIKRMCSFYVTGILKVVRNIKRYGGN